MTWWAVGLGAAGAGYDGSNDPSGNEGVMRIVLSLFGPLLFVAMFSHWLAKRLDGPK